MPIEKAPEPQMVICLLGCIIGRENALLERFDDAIPVVIAL
jgi:hypothetical protein